MEYKRGDRVLYNRQKFGTVWSDQFNRREVDVVFDREKSKIVATRIDMLELVADAHHEAVLAAQINEAIFTDINVPRGQINKSEIVAEHVEPGLAAELDKLAFELEAGADTETNTLRLRATMKNAALRLRALTKDL